MIIISEIGINHDGDFRKIEEMIRQSKIGGADYAKFQLYDSQRVFGDNSRKQNEFSFEQVERLQKICQYYDIEFFASVFDEEKIEWCERLGVGLYKIASRTVITEPDLCKKIIATKKPTYVSLGGWDKPGLPFHDSNIKYLNCISKYPTSVFDFKQFEYNDRIVGISDHSCGISFLLYNIAHGARVIEKHFTLNKGLYGNDHVGSMNLEELKRLREYGEEIKNIRSYIGARGIQRHH